jgi:hypothetical protein
VGPIAQWVQQRTFHPWVDGSSPSGVGIAKAIHDRWSVRQKGDRLLISDIGCDELRDENGITCKESRM